TRDDAVECGPADHYGIRPQCERLHDVVPAAETAVHDDRQALPDGGRDLGDDVYRRHAAVELPSAVVGEHDAIATELRRAFGVGRAQDALHGQLAIPEAAQPGDVVPGDRGTEEVGNDGAPTDGRGRAGRQELRDVL